MGGKLKFVIILISFIGQELVAQDSNSFQRVDSLTYSYYLTGRWSELKETGNWAIEAGSDYKFLRQRLGYTYFVEGDYVRAIKNFGKALEFDSYDPFTLSYLYFANLYLLKPETAGHFASRLSPASRTYYNIHPKAVVENIDFEISSKVPSTRLRSNPWYYRLGIGSRPLPSLGIYQSVSVFTQNISVRYPASYDNFITRQFEYYIIARYSLGKYLTAQGAYHFLYTDNSTSPFHTNVGYAGLVADFNILSFQANASFSKNQQGSFTQTGLTTKVRFPGRQGIFLKGSAQLVSGDDSDEFVYSAGAGFALSRKLFAEGDFTSGNMNYYNDFDGMYVYNSIDPVSRKTGFTLSYVAGNNLTLWFHTGSESKVFFENDRYNYNQITFLGGLRWRH